MEREVMMLNLETLNSIIEEQLLAWPLAKTNIDALANCMRREVMVGDLPVAIQCNPARIRSTGADISKSAIESRPCFLCAHNRPEEQTAIPMLGSLELLVNPYPIFPTHFTIVSKEHRPQGAPPLAMALLASLAPELCIFFNGAKAGASAPDHLHMQGVLSSELPLLRIAEKHHPADGNGLMWSEGFCLDLPFRFLSAVIRPEDKEMKALLQLLSTVGHDAEGNPDPGLVNTYIWTDQKAGVLRGIAIPRRAHRPSCYTAEGEERILVSPGAIDMAGVIITPREEDFRKITEEDIIKIYNETGFSQSL